MSDPYHEIRRDWSTRIGPVFIWIYRREDGKYGYRVEIDNDNRDELIDKRGFKFDWQAQDAATQAIRYAIDIRSGKAFKHYLEDGATRTKGYRKRLLKFFASHFDEIRAP